MKIYDQEETLSVNASTASARKEKPDLSVFLPVYNEEPNLRPLHEKLDQALKDSGPYGRNHLCG